VPGKNARNKELPLTFHEMMNTACSSEILDDEYECTFCRKKRRARTRTTIQQFPGIMVLTLCRFQMIKTSQGVFVQQKVKTLVDMPRAFNAN